MERSELKHVVRTLHVRECNPDVLIRFSMWFTRQLVLFYISRLILITRRLSSITQISGVWWDNGVWFTWPLILFYSACLIWFHVSRLTLTTRRMSSINQAFGERWDNRVLVKRSENRWLMEVSRYLNQMRWHLIRGKCSHFTHNWFVLTLIHWGPTSRLIGMS